MKRNQGKIIITIMLVGAVCALVGFSRVAEADSVHVNISSHTESNSSSTSFNYRNVIPSGSSIILDTISQAPLVQIVPDRDYFVNNHLDHRYHEIFNNLSEKAPVKRLIIVDQANYSNLLIIANNSHQSESLREVKLVVSAADFAGIADQFRQANDLNFIVDPAKNLITVHNAEGDISANAIYLNLR